MDVLYSEALLSEFHAFEDTPNKYDGLTHYSFDYAQSVHYPPNSQQPGPAYFKSAHKNAGSWSKSWNLRSDHTTKQAKDTQDKKIKDFLEHEEFPTWVRKVAAQGLLFAMVNGILYFVDRHPEDSSGRNNGGPLMR